MGMPLFEPNGRPFFKKGNNPFLRIGRGHMCKRAPPCRGIGIDGEQIGLMSKTRLAAAQNRNKFAGDLLDQPIQRVDQLAGFAKGVHEPNAHCMLGPDHFASRRHECVRVFARCDMRLYE